MTTQEFSNAFDTLLSSYNHKADFGDQSSYADVTLDEYEKSVFLTQAQDNIIKTYFDNRANSLGEGFDDNTRRQADFSSLITVATPNIANVGSTWGRGTTMFNGTSNTLTGHGTEYTKYTLIIKFGEAADVAPTTTIEAGGIVITCKIGVSTTPSNYFTQKLNSAIAGIQFQISDPNADNYLGIMTMATAINTPQLLTIVSYPIGNTSAYDDRGQLYTLPSNILLMLNERIKSNNKNYVVVPISYKEYDRQMSRAYAQPLKKQCWRLFEGESTTNTIAEIIPAEGLEITNYKIRFIRRPKPIVLVDLSFVSSQEPLQIDGETHVSECELNPILHMDILEEAVRMALNSKGIETREQKAARAASSKQ